MQQYYTSEIGIMNMTSCLRLCPLKHITTQASGFALVTEVWKWRARKQASGNFVISFANSGCLPPNETGSFYLKRFSVLGRAWKHSSKGAALGRNWKVLGDTSQSFLAVVLWTQHPVEDFRLEGFTVLLPCSCSGLLRKLQKGSSTACMVGPGREMGF